MTFSFRTGFISMALCLASTAHTASAQQTLEIKNFVGTLTVTAVDGDSIEVLSSKNAEGVKLNTSNNGLLIDGGIKKPNGDECEGYYGKYDVSWFGKKDKTGQFGGYKNLKDYPVLTINAPRTVAVIVNNSIPFATFDDIASLEGYLKHCGKIRTGTVSGDVRLSMKGSADVEVGNLKDLTLESNGSGDFDGENARNISVDSTGSGDVELNNVNSAVLRSFGSGDIEMEDVTGAVSLNSRGSGDFSSETIIGDVEYEGRGSGDFSADEIQGNLSIKINGSGDARIDDGASDALYVRVSGSGDVSYDGVAENADLGVNGSGNIYVKRVTGTLTQTVSGSGEISASQK